jgi:hypothetical protein
MKFVLFSVPKRFYIMEGANNRIPHSVVTFKIMTFSMTCWIEAGPSNELEVKKYLSRLENSSQQVDMKSILG